MTCESLPLTSSERLPRCCPRHESWSTLAQHIADAFPQVDLADITRELRNAREAVDSFDVGEDALEMAELIARYRLMVVTGEIAESAKLDPQRHARG